MYKTTLKCIKIKHIREKRVEMYQVFYHLCFSCKTIRKCHKFK